jgi:2-methylisocitrate lyase-like PEP mutase family enzyme
MPAKGYPGKSSSSPVRVREAIPEKPLLWTAGLGHQGGDEIHVDTLKEMGFQIVIYPLVGLVSAMNAVTKLYKRLAQNGVVDLTDFKDGYERIMELSGATFFSEIEEREG